MVAQQPLVIGIASNAYGAGKSTVAERFKNHGDTYRLAYAMALKDLCITMGWNGEKDEKGRRLLQLVGTEACRECLDPEYWVKRWNESYEKFTRTRLADFIICDDLRFENEFANIKRLGGIIIYIVRPEKLTWWQQIKRMLFKKKQHSSEGRIRPGDCHFVIENNGTLAEFETVIDGIIETIKGM